MLQLSGIDTAYFDFIFAYMEEKIPIAGVVADTAHFLAKLYRISSCLFKRAGEHRELGAGCAEQIRWVILLTVMRKLEHIARKFVRSVVAEHRSKHLVAVSLISRDEYRALPLDHLDPKRISVENSVGVAQNRVILIGGRVVGTEKAETFLIARAIF